MEKSKKSEKSDSMDRNAVIVSIFSFCNMDFRIYGRCISGQVTDIEIESKELRDNKEHLLDILAKHTGQDKEKIRRDSERNYYMSAQEAKEYGLIDEVLPLKK